MKPTKLILAGVICSLVLSGCAEQESSQLSENATSPIIQSDVQTYRQLILQLQKELETLQAEQLQQTEDYERRIQTLEAMVAELERDNGSTSNGTNGGTQNENVNSSALYTYTVTASGAIITSYLGKDTLAEIPASLEGIAVVGIGEGAFKNSTVEQVVIPSGVTFIDWFAFYGSYRLSSVILPASVVSISYGAFELCASSLKFTCPSGSYAAQYAESYGIPVIAVAN